MHEANLERPMDTANAIRTFQCEDCAEGDPCEWDCVESSSCSIRCPHCRERNWFAGDLPTKRPWVFHCIKCSKKVTR